MVCGDLVNLIAQAAAEADRVPFFGQLRADGELAVFRLQPGKALGKYLPCAAGWVPPMYTSPAHCFPPPSQSARADFRKKG